MSRRKTTCVVVKVEGDVLTIAVAVKDLRSGLLWMKSHGENEAHYMVIRVVTGLYKVVQKKIIIGEISLVGE